MNQRFKIALAVVLLIGVIGLAWTLLHGTSIAVLDPKGLIALKQRNLMVAATLLTLIVVIPVFILTFVISWKYRASNTAAIYRPDWDHNRLAETIWWIVPLIVIMVLASITWTSSHELDPYKALASSKRPITIQVVALPWKWLFIYPDQGIATVNYVQFPAGTPVNFQITSDAPMNSFWIPQLGGQVYAMTGMTTQLHLIADKPGTYRGSSANLSGPGFAGMHFTATSTSEAGFDDWVRTAKLSQNLLSQTEYNSLAKPSQNNPQTVYASVQPSLFHDIIMKYMRPPAPEIPSTHMPGMMGM